MANLVEKFIFTLFTKKDIHAALDCCSEDICCYSSLAHHACKGKDDMLVMLSMLMETIPREMKYKITNVTEIEIAPHNVVVYVEYDVNNEDKQCWMRGRMSAIKTFRENIWKIRYIHSSGYDIQLCNSEQVLEDCFFNKINGFLGTDISFWYYDIVNKKIIHNKHSIDIHGFSNIVENVPESLIECNYVHPDSAADFQEMYDKLQNGEARVTGDFWIRPDHMDKYWCERIVYTTIYSLENKPIIAMGISKDVTSEKTWNINTSSNYLNSYLGEDKVNHKQEALLRVGIKKQIKKAIDDKEFEIYLQPKIDSHENRVCGAEALIRWRHPNQGLLQPGEFIPKLEALNLTYLLDYFVFKSVCEYQEERMKQNNLIYPISSNLSLHTLSNKEVINLIEDFVQSIDIPKEYIIIEVTETAFVSDIQIALKHIEYLQSLGIKISMDDFGCGTSSFVQLANMPVDELKLDMRLVQNAVSNVRVNAILLSILKLAEWLEIPVVAEGVETEEQVRYLANAGCFICQGYYYSKPLSIPEFERYEKSMS